MKYQQFLSEARANRQDPKPERTTGLTRKEKDQKNIRSQLRRAGDIGKVDMTRQITKEKDRIKKGETFTARTTRERMNQGFLRSQGENALKQLTGKDWTNDKSDRAEKIPATKQVKLNAANKDQYLKNVRDITTKAGIEWDDKYTEGDRLVDRALNMTAPKPKERKNETKSQKKARGKELENRMTNAIENEKLPDGRTVKRDQRIAKGMDAVTAADRALDKNIEDAQKAVLRPALPSNKKIKDVPYMRHAYQPSGVGIGKKNLSKDDINQILAGTIDRQAKPRSRGGFDLQNKAQGQSTKVQTPSAYELESINKEAEKAMGKNRRQYDSKERREYNKKFRQALDTQDTTELQKLFFGGRKVSKDNVDYFLKQLNNPNAIRSITDAGISSPPKRKEAQYGGQIKMTPDEEKKYKNKDGTYNYKAIKMDKKLDRNRKNELMNTIDDNRLKSIVKTYLRGGGGNAYAPFEGLRSISDQQLEHGRSINKPKDKNKQPLKDGKDKPTNWVYAGSELNTLRGNNALTGIAQDYAEGPKGNKNKPFGKPSLIGQDKRLTNLPMLKNRKQYEKDRLTNERDQVIYNDGMREIKQLYPGYTNTQIMGTPEGKKLMMDIKNLSATQFRKKEDEIKPTNDNSTDSPKPPTDQYLV